MKKKIKIGILLLLVLLLIAGAFLSFSYNRFKVEEKFTSLPLSYDPYLNRSTFNWNGADIKFTGGFVKGKTLDDKKIENLVLRSLSPITSLTIKGNPDKEDTYYIRYENVNPVNITIGGDKIDKQSIIDPHTLLIVLSLKQNEERTIEVSPNTDSEYNEFVILGDNRNGYDTFSQILGQINEKNPLFVIDNGDLVYGGEPNKYRLFNQMVSKLRVPLYTTLGNHDIRENGRPTYTMLFGPPYYSFDYGNDHFAFLDSSRGWVEKQTIPEEQYKWLESDLQKASGKRIFVISHIPPVDPRSNIVKNTLPDEPGIEEPGGFDRIMKKYTDTKTMDHGFPDKQEGKRFEDLMTKYKVDTVFVSHIHSYYSYIRGNVQYIISGGAGAELLTTDSYYHYLRVKITDKENYIEMVQLPSPTNTITGRYLAAGQLFAKALFKEYKTTVLLIFTALLGIILWILYATYRRWLGALKFLGGWFRDIIRFAIKRYKEKKQP